METKTKIILAAAALAGAFAFGYFAAPEKIKIEKQIVEVEKKHVDTQTDVERNSHRETTTTETQKPDGTKETTTRTVVDTQTDKKTDSSVTTETDKTVRETKEVQKSTSRLSIAALAGSPVSIHGLGQPVYGASIQRDLIGPINMGLWGLSSGIAGVSLGLTF